MISGYQVFLGGDEDVLKLSVMVTVQLGIGQK
jgi:hypothetical protein